MAKNITISVSQLNKLVSKSVAEALANRDSAENDFEEEIEEVEEVEQDDFSKKALATLKHYNGICRKRNYCQDRFIQAEYRTGQKVTLPAQARWDKSSKAQKEKGIPMLQKATFVCKAGGIVVGVKHFNTKEGKDGKLKKTTVKYTDYKWVNYIRA